jgi:hypothetical protein
MGGRAQLAAIAEGRRAQLPGGYWAASSDEGDVETRMQEAGGRAQTIWRKGGTTAAGMWGREGWRSQGRAESRRQPPRWAILAAYWPEPCRKPGGYPKSAIFQRREPGPIVRVKRSLLDAPL